MARNRVPLAGAQPLLLPGEVEPGLLKAPSRDTDRATGSDGGTWGYGSIFSIFGYYHFSLRDFFVGKLHALLFCFVNLLQEFDQAVG